MRRARSKLQVSTFPFLAVLLAAMGSLIFLLLVMDRRAKIVARNKGREALEARQEAQRKQAAERAAQLLAVRQAAEEEQRRLQEALEGKLIDQKKELHGELDKVKADQIGTMAVLQKEAEGFRGLALEQEALRQSLTAAAKELESKRQARALTQEQEKTAQAAVARMAAELAELEKLVQDLRNRPKRDNVFSLVPYRGKHGENRKPIYIECHARGLTVPASGRSLSILDLEPTSIQQEIQKAGLKLVPKKDAAPPESPSGPPNPYVLCLVRPDGIDHYQKLLRALDGFDVDFGYELVDADWELDYTAEGVPGIGEPLPRLAARGKFPGGPGGYKGPGGSDKPGGILTSGPGTGPFPPGFPASPGSASPGSASPGSGFPSKGPGSPRTIGPEPGPGPKETGKGPGSPFLAKDNPSEMPRGAGPFGPNPPGTSPGSVGPGKGPASAVIAKGKPSGADKGPVSPPPPPPGPGIKKDGAPGKDEPPEVAWRGSKKGEPRTENPEGEKSGADGSPSGAAEGPRFRDPLAKSVPRPASLGHMLANRELLIVISCMEKEAILAGTGLRFPTNGDAASQERGIRELRDTVRNLIDRRQASLRPGEPPFRPVIRFQVHSGGLGTYFRVYPTLVELRVPLQRENVE